MRCREVQCVFRSWFRSTKHPFTSRSLASFLPNMPLLLPPLVLFCPCALLAILLKLLGFGGIVAGSRMMRLSAVIAINFAGGRLARSVSNRRKVDNFQHARTVVMGLAAFWLTEVGEEPIGPNGRASLNSLSSSR
jgi:hypothetical protein